MEPSKNWEDDYGKEVDALLLAMRRQNPSLAPSSAPGIGQDLDAAKDFVTRLAAKAQEASDRLRWAEGERRKLAAELEAKTSLEQAAQARINEMNLLVYRTNELFGDLKRRFDAAGQRSKQELTQALTHVDALGVELEAAKARDAELTRSLAAQEAASASAAKTAEEKRRRLEAEGAALKERCERLEVEARNLVQDLQKAADHYTSLQEYVAKTQKALAAGPKGPEEAHGEAAFKELLEARFKAEVDAIGARWEEEKRVLLEEIAAQKALAAHAAEEAVLSQATPDSPAAEQKLQELKKTILQERQTLEADKRRLRAELEAKKEMVAMQTERAETMRQEALDALEQARALEKPKPRRAPPSL